MPSEAEGAGLGNKWLELSLPNFDLWWCQNLFRASKLLICRCWGALNQRNIVSQNQEASFSVAQNLLSFLSIKDPQFKHWASTELPPLYSSVVSNAPKSSMKKFGPQAQIFASFLTFNTVFRKQSRLYSAGASKERDMNGRLHKSMTNDVPPCL